MVTIVLQQNCEEDQFEMQVMKLDRIFYADGRHKQHIKYQLVVIIFKSNIFRQKAPPPARV